MTVAIAIAVLTAVTAVIGSFVTWKIAKRNASGAIDTSVAADLWAEGGKIRTELRTDLADTKQKLEETNTALRSAVAAVSALNDEIRAARERADCERVELREQISALTAQVTELSRAQTAQTTNLSARTTDLHNEVKTSNGLTIGGLADNTETRRILAVPSHLRTAAELEHLRSAPDRLPPDLAARQSMVEDENA